MLVNNCSSKRWIIVLALVMFVCAGIDSSAGTILPKGALDGDGIGKLVSGKTIVTKDDQKRSRMIFFSADGDFRQITHGGYYERGRWKVRENRLCTKVFGDRDCRIIVKKGNSYQTYVPKKDNNPQFEEDFISIKSGNLVYPVLEKKLAGGVALPPGVLNSKDVMDLFYNRTVESVTAVKKRESRSYYAPNGEVRQYRNGVKRTGKWRVRADGRICLAMEGLPAKCRIIVNEDGEYRKYIVKKNGRNVHSVSYPKFRKGNPYNL